MDIAAVFLNGRGLPELWIVTAWNGQFGLYVSC
jgi:hypothetical protein